MSRPEVPTEIVARLRAVFAGLPECVEEAAWVGLRWRIRQATVAQVFGGEDQRFRLTFRAEPAEVAAFEHLGPPYFKAEWGGNVVGLVLDRDTDWDEVAECLTDSYRLQAPARLVADLPSDSPPT